MMEGCEASHSSHHLRQSSPALWQKGVLTCLSTSQDDNSSGLMVKHLRLNQSFWFKTYQHPRKRLLNHFASLTQSTCFLLQSDLTDKNLNLKSNFTYHGLNRDGIATVLIIWHNDKDLQKPIEGFISTDHLLYDNSLFQVKHMHAGPE